jgi:DNA-binding beta-propeller fold protein YncE
MISHRFVCAAAIASACLMLTDCSGESGSSVPYPGLGALQQNAFEHQRAGSLLFVSDSGTNDVSVFSFPKGAPVRTLDAAFSEPQGECTDGKNVYVANTEASNVVEFAADGSTPTRTIDDQGYFPGFCSYDSTTGDLAVGNIISTTSGPGSIAIYRKSSGKPHFITSNKTLEIFSVQYDGSGNLFMTGFDAQFYPFFGELPAGSKHIKIICSSTSAIGFPGALGWDGRYIVVGGTGGVYRVRGCTNIGFTPLDGGGGGAFYIDGKYLVMAYPGSSSVQTYDYPKGGAAISTIGGFYQPIGVVAVKAR